MQTKTRTEIKTNTKAVTKVVVAGIIAAVAAAMIGVNAANNTGLQFLDRGTYKFGTVMVGDLASKTFVVKNMEKRQPINFAIKSLAKGFTINTNKTTCKHVLKPRETCRVTVVFKPQEVKRYKAELNVISRKGRTKKSLRKRLVGFGMSAESDRACIDSDEKDKNDVGLPYKTYKFANLTKRGHISGIHPTTDEFYEADDKCWNEGRILEYFCNENTGKVSWNSYDCPGSCLEGRCVLVSVEPEVVPAADPIIDPNSVITFPDENLETIIRQKIDKLDEDIIVSDVQDIEELIQAGCFAQPFITKVDKPVANLSGLEYLSKLKKLCMVGYNSNITNLDLAPLTNLVNLETLDLRFNGITNVKPLENLINLKSLYLANNIVVDISSLENLIKLKTLDISSNSGLSDISVLANFPDMWVLTIGQNSISNLSALANLTNIVALYAENNNISDISALTNLSELKTLRLGYNNIQNISALANLTKIEGRLGLNNNFISSLVGLENSTNVKYLDIGDNVIQSLSPIQNITKLEKLWAENNNINNLSGLDNLSNLKELDFRNNQVTDVSVLDAISGLNKVQLNGNTIVSGCRVLVSLTKPNIKAYIEPDYSYNTNNGIIYADEFQCQWECGDGWMDFDNNPSNGCECNPDLISYSGLGEIAFGAGCFCGKTENNNNILWDNTLKQCVPQN